MSRLGLHFLGSPQVHLNDQLIVLKERKALALLVYLTVTAEPHQREALATLYWPEQSAKQGRAYLRRLLWVLKEALGDGWIDTDGDTLGLSQTAEIWVDVIAFNTV